MKARSALFALLAVMLLALSACSSAKTTDTASPSAAASAKAEAPTLSIASPKDGEEIKGNVASLQLSTDYIKIVKADGDTSGKSGHFHVFVDKDPVAAGEVIPNEKGAIFHSAANPVLVPGLAIGDHTLTVVLGDGAHKRIGTVEAKVKVKVTGPSLQATIDSELPTGQEGMLQVKVDGVTLVKPAEDNGPAGKTGHLHVLIDPETPPKADGQAIAPAVENKIIHTVDTAYKIKGLGPGEHIIWVVLGDKAHVPFAPLVADMVKITIK